MEHGQGTGAGIVLAGRYRLGDVLGRGGMGKVWRAHDQVLHRTVAVKELTAGLYVSEADRAVLHARTQKEARAAARITHPGVVTVHDVVEYDSRPWIVMQYVDGPSLADAVKESGATEPREAARIGLRVLGALRAAHAAGVLHRDVKPANVLLARDGQVLLTDFGIAAIEGDSTITRTGELVGSIDYLAPERVRGGDPGPASDLWSLGVTLYTAVEGTSPFRRTSPISTMQAVVTEEPPPPLNGGALAPVITALLRKDPAGRPGAEETERMLLDAMEGRRPRAAQAHVPTQRVPEEELRSLSASEGSTVRLPGQPLPVPPYASPPPPRRGPGRWRTVLLVVVAAALIGGAAAGVVAMRQNGGGGTSGGSEGRSGSPSPSVTSSASSSTGADERGAKGVPEGWTRIDAPEGFGLTLPEGWERQPDEGQIDYSPDGGAHRLRISIDPQPDFDDSHAHMQSIEKDLARRLPDYERLTLEPNVFRDRPGARWEFDWTESKDHPGPRHGIDQMYFAERGGPEYALYMTGPQEDREATRKLFETMLRSWQPPDRPG
ncbi:serine/threonine-protein kinase [Streptomyces sp. NPDC059166]|uniref:serine/threonine-protein kinase n=1 Tax=Streptomyces sp. NPDC059166 TaxID=3346752 RepID=UPI00368987F2